MYSEIVILAMLRQRPRHGYEIKKDVERVLGTAISINNTILYPTLKHFEEVGAVVRQVVEQEGKPNRHLYELTEQGIELMEAYLRDFPPELAANDAEFFTRVAFFDYLEPEVQQRILKMRLAFVQNQLIHLQKVQQLAGESSKTNHAQRVLAFHFQQIRGEYQWLANWLEEMQTDMDTKKDD